MKSFVVIGLGLFGRQLVNQLYERDIDVLAIDINEEKVDMVANVTSKAVIADARKKEVLEKLDVKNFDVAVVAMTSDLATSVLITMNLQSLGVKEIVCKTDSKVNAEVLSKLGATKVIIPERDSAEKLARNLLFTNVIDYIELSGGGYGLMEIEAPKDWVNKNLIEINVRKKYGVNIVSVVNSNNNKFMPAPDYVIKGDDRLYIVGANEDLTKVTRLDKE